MNSLISEIAAPKATTRSSPSKWPATLGMLAGAMPRKLGCRVGNRHRKAMGATSTDSDSLPASRTARRRTRPRYRCPARPLGPGWPPRPAARAADPAPPQTRRVHRRQPGISAGPARGHRRRDPSHPAAGTGTPPRPVRRSPARYPSTGTAGRPAGGPVRGSTSPAARPAGVPQQRQLV